MLNDTTAEAPQSKSALPLSEHDRTIVARLIALNIHSEGSVGAPLDRVLSTSDATPRLTHELHRELVGRNETQTERVAPETILRAWVQQKHVEPHVARTLSQNNDAIGLVQGGGKQHIVNAFAKEMTRVASMPVRENIVNQSTASRHSENDVRRVEARRGMS
jgi:hypothetical protein